MSVHGIRGLSDIITEIATIRIGPSETEIAGEELRFCSHPNLNVDDKNYDITNMNYDYLTDLTDIKFSKADAKVILGQDAYHVIRPLD